MHRIDSFRRWVIVSALTGCAVAANATGCGGSNSSSTGRQRRQHRRDGGREPPTAAAAAGAAAAGRTAPATPAAAAEAPAAAPAALQQRSDTGSGSGGSRQRHRHRQQQRRHGQRGTETSTACTGSETACTIGSIDGLCVSGVCMPCQDPSDDGNCTNAYGGGSTRTSATRGQLRPGQLPLGRQLHRGPDLRRERREHLRQLQQRHPVPDRSHLRPGRLLQQPAGRTASAPRAHLHARHDVRQPGRLLLLGGRHRSTCVPGNCCTNADCTSATPGPSAALDAQRCGPCTLGLAVQRHVATPICDTPATAAPRATASRHACTGTPGSHRRRARHLHAERQRHVLRRRQPLHRQARRGRRLLPGLGGQHLLPGAAVQQQRHVHHSFTCTTCDAVSLTTPIYYRRSRQRQRRRDGQRARVTGRQRELRAQDHHAGARAHRAWWARPAADADHRGRRQQRHRERG